MRTSHLLIACAAALACAPKHAAVVAPASNAAPPALDAIREADLRRDLFALASPSMRGRESGTLDELRAAVWLADQARAAGLEPAGDDGGYLQYWSIRRTRLTSGSTLSLGGQPLALGREAVLLAPVESRVELPVVWVGEGTDAQMAGVDVRGKAAAAMLSLPAGLPPVGAQLSSRRYTMLAVRSRAAALIERGAAAVILVSDSIADPEFDNIGTGWMRGSYAIEDPTATRQAPNAATAARPPVVWLRRASLDQVRAPGARLVAALATESFVVPSANVIARVRGSDPSLAAEHVLFSAHHDALGVRYAWNGDSVWKGADDNGSTSVALLAIGRAFVRRPARRSALFVWHAAEEVGLLGSRWYATHPTVPKSSIVAVLNGDMIGRNNADSAGLMGIQPPNRNSTALARMALDANTQVARFTVDTTWDRPTNPEGLFQRSDHWPYVREGIPVVYFSTLLDPDYHTPRDDAERVDYAKLTRMTRWMYATGWAAAVADARPALDPSRPAR